MKQTRRLMMAAAIAPAALYSQQAYAEKVENNRPNILFCIADDATFYHFSKAGCSWVDTPNFDRVANEGIFFNNCYTQNAKSAPSRAILLTGRYSWQLGEAGNHICNFPSDVKVFTEVLSNVGYDVAFTGKGWAPGNPGTIDGEPRRLTGMPYQKKRLQAPTSQIGKCDYFENFKDFLDSNQNGKPWFFWFGSTEPHRAYEYGSGVRLGGKDINDIDEVPDFWPDNEKVRNDMLDYAYEIEYFDKQIGKMLAELESRGILDNTLIVITSDNGMPFPRCKANDYEYSNHMPCAMMWKAGIRNPGRTVSSYISFIDMAPTFLDLADADGEEYGMKEISGESLTCFLKDKAGKKVLQDRQKVILGRERDDYGRPANQGYPIRAIIQDHYLYIWNIKPHLMPAGYPETGYMDVDGSPTKTCILEMNRNESDSRLWEFSFGLRPEHELYDLRTDRYCTNNLASNPLLHKIMEDMIQTLKKELIKQNDPRMGPDGDIFDSYPFDRKEIWNFYERVVSGEITEPWINTKWINPTDYETHPDNQK